MHPPSLAPLPDLLYADAQLRIAPEPTDLALVMAFAGGTSGGLFSDALSQAQVAPSTWQPAAYAADLFLNTFVAQCFRVSVRGTEPTSVTEHTVRVLASPPADPQTIELRRGIIGELDHSPALRKSLESLYVGLARLRGALEGTIGPLKIAGNRRQLAIFEVFRDVINLLTEGFGDATSGLSRLSTFGQAVRTSEGFQSLLDLLNYDEQLANVNLNVAFGADGRVRHLEIQQVTEAHENVFVNPPWKRWLARVELFLRGFHFSDGEVMARLLDAVFDGVRPEFLPLVQLLGDVEFYLGALGFNDRARRAGLAVCLPELVGREAPRQLLGLFNPLLLSGAQPPVPCDITTDRHDATVLITGPNSGGKTRLLQALGLAQLLAQSGLFVPARAASLALCPGLVVSLIQETRFDQSEGRLGMELLRIRSLFETLPPGAMVILDELCSGTNPSEGEEIFELVVRMLSRLRPQAFITTHFLDFAARLKTKQEIDGLRFLQVILGPEHQPTYQFGGGVASTSLAAHAAARLGVTGDQLLGLIDRNIKAAKGGPL